MKTGSDTPEVDGERMRLLERNETPHNPVSANFARRLERERDQLRKLLAESHDIISCLANATTPRALEWLKQYRSSRKP